MCSLPTTERHRQLLRGFRRTVRIALKGSKPAQVVLQVASGHAVEFPYPCFEPTVIRIDILNMPRTRPHGHLPRG
jgi:ribosomal protein L19